MGSIAPEKAILIDRSKSLVEQPSTGHNRWHPEIAPILSVAPGEVLAIETRDSMDGQIVAGAGVEAFLAADFGRVHPLTGPVKVEGAEPGDLLEVEILEVIPQDYGFGIQYHTFGMLRDYSPGPFLAHFHLADGFATSEQLPRVRFRAAPFMGVMGVAPDRDFLQLSWDYETRLGLAGCEPSSGASCVPSAEEIARRGLRTIPPRSNGGNIDVRQLTAGSSLYLPVFVPGALFSAGDAHFAQGESECVTGLEMGATLVCRFKLHKGLAEKRRIRDPQFSFREPSNPPGETGRRFYATTGQCFTYGEEGTHSDLEAAARNALLNMVRHLEDVYGYDFQQAYLISSLAADLRISQAVNVPNFTVSAVLDLSIFD